MHSHCTTPLITSAIMCQLYICTFTHLIPSISYLAVYSRIASHACVYRCKVVIEDTHLDIQLDSRAFTISNNRPSIF
jgi:hypothetical protein